MDSLRGIPVEHKLETFSMPSTGTTSCHPKKWLRRSERNSALDTLAIISPLAHINGDNAYSPPKKQIQNYTVTLNTSLTRPTTRCHLNIPLSHFASNTNKPKLHESCSTKSKPYSKLQIKTFSVVLLKKSFVIHLCCLKKNSAREINNLTNRYSLFNLFSKTPNLYKTSTLNLWGSITTKPYSKYTKINVK